MVASLHGRAACVMVAVNVAFAATATAAPRPEPSVVTTVGPWEAVTWTVGKQIDHCTLIRAAAPDEGPHYGFLVDRGARVMSVATSRWKVPSGAPTTATVKPAAGSERKLTVTTSSPGRANVDIDAGLLDDLQKSTHLDMRVGETSLRLAFDAFTPARAALEKCVKAIGTEHKAPPQ